VQSNQLVAKNVVARRNGFRDLHHPGVVVGDELVVAPGAWHLRVVHQPYSVDLEELERSFVDRCTGCSARRQVVYNGSVMRFWPRGSPLELNAITSSNFDIGLRVGGVLVADDVGRVVLAGGDEAVAGVGGGPSGDLGRVRHVRIAVNVKASIGHSVDDNVGDMAVGSDTGGGQQSCQERQRLCLKHCKE
jgi:hypothetical protein